MVFGVGEAGGDEFVTVQHTHDDEAGGPDVGDLREGDALDAAFGGGEDEVAVFLLEVGLVDAYGRRRLFRCRSWR